MTRTPNNNVWICFIGSWLILIQPSICSVAAQSNGPNPQTNQVRARLTGVRLSAPQQTTQSLKPIVNARTSIGVRPEFEFPRSFQTPAEALPQEQTPSSLDFTTQPINSSPFLDGVATDSAFQRLNDQSQEELPPALDQPSDPNVIRQRYPDGKIQIQRHVAQDENGNFYNHGIWEAFDRKGVVVAKGNYQHGLLDGQWMRKHDANSDGLFKTKPFNLFQGPFYSIAHFNQGKLNGVWKIFDPFHRSIFEIPYQDGKRHGTATWWFPDAGKMRTAHFKNGLIDGEVIQWDRQQQTVGREEFNQGRKIVRETAFYRPGQRESEDFYLDAKLVPQGADNWWDAQPSPYLPEGTRVQSGSSMAWYSNNQPRKKGQFKAGQPTGQFTWWHSNGNIKTQGMYSNDGKHGRWTWWFENGMKKFEGSYENNAPVGVWRAWNSEGQIQKEDDLSAPTQTETLPSPDQSDQNLPKPKSVVTPESNDSDFVIESEPEQLPAPPKATTPIPEIKTSQDADGNQAKDGDSENLESIVPVQLDGPEKSSPPTDPEVTLNAPSG